LGLHIANRPLDAFCSAIACLYLTFLHRKSYVAILKPLSIMCCGLFILCGYNWVISGKFSFSTYPILNAEFKVIYPEANGLFNGLSLFVAEYKSSLIKNLWPLVTTQYFYYMGVILPLIAVVGLISTLKEKLTVSLILHVFLLLTLYNFHNSQGWPQYGARYYYPTWIGLGVLTAFGLKFLSEKFLFKSDKKTRLLALTSITFLVVSFQIFSQLSFLEKYANRFEFVKLFHRELSKSCNPKDIVAFKYKSWARNVSTSFLGPIDFVRNGNGENDYLFVLNSTDLASAKQSYPERSVCKFAFPKFRLKE